ncbi:MAG: hypothetical protein ABIS29_20240, partial [Vicinamibacterales bacterium]
MVFKNGRTMSVQSIRIDADTATMQLRDGGEVAFPASAVARVHPDEVPYPDPAGGSREPAAETNSIAIDAAASASLVRFP